MSRRAAFLIAAALFAPAAAFAQTAFAQTASTPPANGHEATLYRGGPAELRETRPIALDGPADVLIARGLPDDAEGESLEARFLPAAGGAAIVPDALALQEAEAEPGELLRRMVGREITWLTRNPATGAEEEITGRLRSAGRGWPVIERADGALEVLPPGRLLLERPPADLALERSAAVRFVEPVTTGTLLLRYRTAALSWDARYDGVLSEDGSTLTLSADYLIRNDGLKDVVNAAVTMVAGDVPRADGGGPQPKAEAMSLRMAADAAGGPPPAQASGDRQLFALAAPIDLPGRSTVRRPLLLQETVPVTRRYVLEGRGEAWPGRAESGAELLRPQVEVTLANAADGPLARPLPAGVISVRAPEAAPQTSPQRPGAGFPTRLLAEARLPDLSVGAETVLALGEAFDVTARRTLTAFEWVGPADERSGRRPYEAEHEIHLKNAKDAAVTVQVVERFNGPFTMLSASHPADRSQAGVAVFAVEIPARAETALTYRVRVGDN